MFLFSSSSSFLFPSSLPNNSLSRLLHLLSAATRNDFLRELSELCSPFRIMFFSVFCWVDIRLRLRLRSAESQCDWPFLPFSRALTRTGLSLPLSPIHPSWVPTMTTTTTTLLPSLHRFVFGALEWQRTTPHSSWGANECWMERERSSHKNLCWMMLMIETQHRAREIEDDGPMNGEEKERRRWKI